MICSRLRRKLSDTKRSNQMITLDPFSRLFPVLLDGFAKRMLQLPVDEVRFGILRRME